MVQRALVSYPEFELSRIDIDRPPPHYAVDTVEIAKRLFPNSELLYVIGGDSLRDLPRWHNPASFLSACDQIGVMRRPGDSIDLGRLDVALPGLREKVVFIDTPLLEISSHEIRQRVSAGRAFRQYLMAPVYDYIVFTKLYKTGEESR
jgi:nicotinate-nucleotide adenylyltransferase